MDNEMVGERLAIRELLETFMVGCMRADSGIWGSTWAEEASWKIDRLDAPAVGRGNVIAVFEEIIVNIRFVSMNSFPTELAIEGNSASGKAYSQEIIFPKAGGQRILVGCSHDEYIKQNGRWYFLSRHFETLWRSAIE